MKRVLIAGIFIILAGSSLQGCLSGKDWICECQDGNFTYKYLITNQPKGDAQKMCDYIKVEDEHESCTVKEL
ncbi:MAG: hypothetical protein GXO48_02210 [Chlorobi bacterium]|nr:hypothetical protein [Chlorobiota bacterium]